MNGREPMTHEIVRNVLLLITRLGKHKENHEQAKNERRLNELNLLSEVLHALPANVFDALSEKCDKLPLAEHGALKLYLIRASVPSLGMSNAGPALPVIEVPVANALAEFTFEEVLCGLVTALADRVEAKHEAARKVARVNRKLRAILAILDNT